jgi:hypothetical protein
MPLPILWAEVLTPSDPRVSSPEMTTATQDELDQLFARGTFRLSFVGTRVTKRILSRQSSVHTIQYEDRKYIRVDSW